MPSLAVGKSMCLFLASLEFSLLATASAPREPTLRCVPSGVCDFIYSFLKMHILGTYAFPTSTSNTKSLPTDPLKCLLPAIPSEKAHHQFRCLSAWPACLLPSCRIWGLVASDQCEKGKVTVLSERVTSDWVGPVQTLQVPSWVAATLTCSHSPACPPKAHLLGTLCCQPKPGHPLFR